MKSALFETRLLKILRCRAH